MNGWAARVCGPIWHRGEGYRTFGGAPLARRICLCRVRWTPSVAAEEASAGVRMCGLPPAGIGDCWNGVSPDANRADQVVSRRLSDGPRQARGLGQVSATGTRRGLSDGLDHGAQAAPWAERGPIASAAWLSGGGRDLYWWPRRPDKSRSQHGQPRQKPGRGCRRKGGGAEEPERKAWTRRQAPARVLRR